MTVTDGHELPLTFYAIEEPWPGPAWQNLFRVTWPAYRSWYLWSAHKDWYQPTGTRLRALQGIDWILLLLALSGAGFALARGGPGRGVAVLVLAYTLVLASHHVEARFAMPFRGLFLAFVVLALVTAARRLRHTDE